MQLEHIAINVSDPVAIADWYVAHCDMRIVIALTDPPYTRFIVDQTGRTCIELYANPAAAVPDYSNQHHLIYHQAFSVEDIDGEKARLMEAGASYVESVRFPNGTRLEMLRDPWGIPLQLVKRVDKWY